MNDSVNINKHLGYEEIIWFLPIFHSSNIHVPIKTGEWMASLFAEECFLTLQRDYGVWSDITFHRPTLDSIQQWDDIFVPAHETQSSQCLMGSVLPQPSWWGWLGHHCEGNRITCSSLVTQWPRAQVFLGFSIPRWQKYANHDFSYRTKPSSKEYTRYINLIFLWWSPAVGLQ